MQVPTQEWRMVESRQGGTLLGLGIYACILNTFKCIHIRIRIASECGP